MSATGRAFLGGRVYTQDPACPWAGGLVVAAGRIARLLHDGEAAPPGVPAVDLGGRLVLPGLVDAHTHLTLHARHLDDVALGGVATLAEALACVRAAASRIRPRAATEAGDPARADTRRRAGGSSGWVLGQGWDPHAWGGFPDRTALDRVAPGVPVALESRDCHASWLSSAALEAAGIDAATPDPPGGRILRDAAGEPTGILLENATRLAAGVIPREDGRREERLERALAEALSLGLTGLHVLDGRAAMEELLAYDAERGLPLRLVCYVREADLDRVLGEGRRSGGEKGRVRLGGVKLFADGALGSRTALLSEPYAGTTDDFGIAIHGDADLADLARRAAEGGLAVAIHAIGDRANTRALDALEAAVAVRNARSSRTAGGGSGRGAASEAVAGDVGAVGRDATVSSGMPSSGSMPPDRIEHAQLVFPADAARFGRHAVVASVQPCHIPGDWEAADRHWGDRCRYAYPFRTLLAGGANLALGSDVPVEGWNPFRNLYAAVARRGWDGRPRAGWYPEEALGLAEAILAYTVGSAVASGDASRRGRLVPGMDADFIALSKDLFALPPEEWLDVRCELTVVGGEIQYGAEQGGFERG